MPGVISTISTKNAIADCMHTESKSTIFSKTRPNQPGPTQAWLAVRAPLLRSAATQFHLLRHRVLHMFSFKAGRPHATDVADLHTSRRSKVGGMRHTQWWGFEN